MDFSNPAATAGQSAERYVAALLELLGDQDPFEILERLPDVIEPAVAGLDGQDLRRPEGPGKWSILEVVQHLADSELVYGYRIRAMLTEDGPALAGYDQDVWARDLRYVEVEIADALHQLAALRAANLRLVRSLSEAELERWGVHAERGRESVRQLIDLLAAHDLVHLRQIARIKESLGRA